MIAPLIRSYRRSRVKLAGALTVALAASGVAFSALSAQAAAAPDGATAATAAASCWEIKQTKSTATDGLYWLYTPDLLRPQQFYCDQTTDGGGWVLIGRGRQGWSFLDEGQNISAVANPTTGTAAFTPAQLNGDTVRGLLAKGKVSGLADGIRVRRASNATGSAWQELRMYPSGMDQWRWVLNGGYPLTKLSINGAAYAGGTSAHAGSGTGNLVLDTQKTKANTYLPGFAYGSGTTGSSSSTSYLWSPTNAGNAVPFAQVYLRPTLRLADLGSARTDAITNPAVVSNLAHPQPAGVSGLANGFTSERDTEVRAFTKAGSAMIVGGNFAQVDLYTTKTSVPQSYVAAFSQATGDFLPGFKVALNGKVNSLATLPNGNVAIGGEFTTVNGVAQSGLVVVNPSTGAVVPSFTSTLVKRTSTATTPGLVTGLTVMGNTLYVAGSFTHVSGGGSGFVYAKNGVRLDAATGKPDSKWNPAFNGTPVFVSPSQAGDRVYYGGFMTTMNDGANTAKYFAPVTTAAGVAAPVAGVKAPVYSVNYTAYQQTGVEVGNRFWLGGSEHSFYMYNKADLGLLRGNITRSDNGSGGDFQASVADGGVVYGSCHCILSNNYGDGRAWPTPTSFDDIDSLRYIGAYDAATGRQISSFLPVMKTRAVRGPWAMAVDANRCMWAGGDTTETKSTAGVWQPSGGFSRWCLNDTMAPATPAAPKVTTSTTGVSTISWQGVTDNVAGTINYVLLRDGIAVWSGYSWKTTLPQSTGAKYAVRAYDKAGNYSAISASTIG